MILIFIIMSISFIIGYFYSEKNLEEAGFLGCLFASLVSIASGLFTFLFLIILGAALIQYNVIELKDTTINKQNIFIIKDININNGLFSVGTELKDNKIVYYALIQTKDGYKIQYFDANKVKIKETNNNNAYVETIEKTPNNKFLNLLFYNFINDYNYIFYVPKNSIFYNFS